MSESALNGIRACVFDAYGTLFDYASAAAGCRDLLGDRLNSLNTLWREKQLQYTWLRSLQGKHADFWQVTRDALDFALETLGIASADLRARLMNLYLALDAQALAALDQMIAAKKERLAALEKPQDKPSDQ
jgi:2-haloacid dehalogenase